MILADKIIEERKKNGWSQEELAEKLDVSRQSVSKWEGAQSTPDLQKILKMSELFGVSTDYLLKDEIEGAEYIETEKESESPVHKISMEEANSFLEINSKIAPKQAFATALCVLSPVCLMVLGGLTTTGTISENFAGSIGMTVLLLMIACAVAIFIFNDKALEKYRILAHEKIETAYGVSGMVKERKSKYASTHTRNTVIGTCLCIVGVIALFLVPVLGESDFIGASMMGVMLTFESCGTFFLVLSSNINSGFDKLLEEGDYTLSRKQDKTSGMVAKNYWLLATAIYLIWSFTTNSWNISWIVWAVAGVLYPVVGSIAKFVVNSGKKQ